MSGCESGIESSRLVELAQTFPSIGREPMNRISQPGWRSSTHHVLIAIAAILLIACGKKAADTSGSGTVASDNPSGESNLASGAGQNPCSLLEPKEVEAILGVALAGPPYRYNNTGKEGPAPDGTVCRYETAAYHVVDLEVEWTGGAQLMKMYGAVQNLADQHMKGCLLYTSPSPRDRQKSRMPSSA